MSTSKKKNVNDEFLAKEAEDTKTNQISVPIQQGVEFKLGIKGKEIVSAFREELINCKKQKSTLRSYIFDINSFIAFVESKGQMFEGKFDRLQFEEYIKMQQEANYKPNTINKRINSLQSFNKFLIKQELMTDMIVNLVADKIQID